MFFPTLPRHGSPVTMVRFAASRREGTRVPPNQSSDVEDDGFQHSSNIILNSTAALTQDVAYKAPITTVAANSEKLSIKYSILVTQTALTKEAYIFWDNLRKNTEKLGSIFDAQPSQILGNIHNIADASEPIIGYISAGTRQSKRIFIKKSDLPPGYRFEYPYTCKIDTAYLKSSTKPLVSTVLIPTSSPYIALADTTLPGTNPPILVGYTYSGKPCADCTLNGGRVPQPSFWQ